MRKLSEIIAIGLKAAAQMDNPMELGMCVILRRASVEQYGKHDLFVLDKDDVLTIQEVEKFNEFMRRYLERHAYAVYLYDALRNHLPNGQEPTNQMWFAWYRRRLNYYRNKGN